MSPNLLKLKTALLRLHEDTLFRNSFYLMLATAVIAGFGFIFWLITAHIYPVSSIGIATTLISVMNLIALLSLVGLDTALVRFLPTSTQRNEKMNTSLLLVTLASFVLSTGFVLFVKQISPDLSFIQSNPWYFSIFIFSCIMNSLNVLTDAIFLAGKKTKYTLIVNILSSILKILTPFFFISLGAIGIFISAALAQTLGTSMSLYIMMHRFDYHPQLTINTQILKGVWKYSGMSYMTNVLNLLPATVLPILILNTIGADAAAVYYMVMMIGNLLYTIPWSTAKSFFAEGSHDERYLLQQMDSAIRTITILVIPSIIALLIFGKEILEIFGKKYEHGGATFLYLITFTAITVSINSIYGSIFRVLHKLGIILATNVLSVVSVFILLYFFLPLGLFGVGLAWFLNSAIVSAASALLYYIYARPSIGTFASKNP